MSRYLFPSVSTKSADLGLKITSYESYGSQKVGLMPIAQEYATSLTLITEAAPKVPGLNRLGACPSPRFLSLNKQSSMNGHEMLQEAI